MVVPGEGEQGNERNPPGAEVQMSEEDRIRLLIAKCYDDGVFPERLKHGEFVIDNEIRVFKVNPQLDRLTTAWLKERTVTVILQGVAHNLPARLREDLIRVYENGWSRQRTFARGFKRGRVHGEGPNVMSYVAKSREIAQWLVAKAEDVVVIRRNEYKLLFKPWMMRAELEERRRQEDETKFWVTTLRVPLRVMFHVPDLVQQVMGNIILQHPPKPDASRPKLMNLKFELPREAEERFEPTLPMKLVDGEIYNVEFVCKNTPWCTRYRWWFRTESDGCPRADEEVEGRDFQGAVAGRSRGRGSNQNFNQGEVVYQRGIRDATRDVASVQDGEERPSRGGGVSGNASRQQPSQSVIRDQGQNSTAGG
ncbi:hypothetical protein CBR_g40097 [Chara braunii]|uniref:Uncharacterized protein n=1 Tax=Chara braunii TaxID=69332 RepID=A0A388LT66_CHABU|nr:hypothetical protein CBR_g40097 [Chara braunii]|eukprot:GBG85455.1 hypothetical protein CBR_g40097 [Chara braunii]